MTKIWSGEASGAMPVGYCALRLCLACFSKGSAISISTRLLDDVMHRQLAHVPFTGLRVVLRRGESMPRGIVYLRIIAAIIVTRPSGFLPVQRVPEHGLGSPDPVVEFPRSLELMEVLGTDMVEILLQHVQKLQAPVEHRFAGHIKGADAADVLIHDLLQPLQALKRRDVARRHAPGDDLVPAHFVVFQRLEYRFLKHPDLSFVYLWQVPDQLH